MGTRLGYFLLLLGGGIGLPFPEDLTLVGGGVLSHRHVLSLLYALCAGIVAVFCADWILYLVGRHYGRDIVTLPFVLRHVGTSRLETVRATVDATACGPSSRRASCSASAWRRSSAPGRSA